MDDQLNKLVGAIHGHGDQIADNLVLLKKFLAARQEDQQKFLAEQREASDKAQSKSYRAAFWSAIAAGAAACAAVVQAYAAIATR
jgi:anti-sigma-K factor RskA